MATCRDDLYRLPADRKRLLAHDVRHLMTCEACGGLADDRMVISGKWHPRCCFNRFGQKFVLGLPDSDRSKFCLSDVDVPTMRRLVA